MKSLSKAALALAVTAAAAPGVAHAQYRPQRGGSIEQQIVNEIGNALNQMNRPRPVPFPGGNNGVQNLNPGAGFNLAPGGSSSVGNLSGGGFGPGIQPMYNPGFPGGQPMYNPDYNPGYVNQPYYQTPGYQTPGYYTPPVQGYPAQDPYAQQAGYTYAPTTTYVSTGATRYQIPAGYGGSAVGSVINYGGANYSINADGTMSPAGASGPAAPAAPAAQRYHVPAEYAGMPAGYVINYGGANYLTNGDGTMSPY